MNNTGVNCTSPLTCRLKKKKILQSYAISDLFYLRLQNYRYEGLTCKLYSDFQLYLGN